MRKAVLLMIMAANAIGLAGCFGTSSQLADGEIVTQSGQQDQREEASSDPDRHAQETKEPDVPVSPGVSDNPETGEDAASEPDDELDDSWKEEAQGLSTEQIEFLDLLFGRWIHEEQNDLVLNLGYGTEQVGVQNGQLLAHAEFSISEINQEEQYIVIEGIRETVIFSEEEPDKQNYASKILLQEDGLSLVYIYDYLGEQVESTWVRVQQ